MSKMHKQILTNYSFDGGTVPPLLEVFRWVFSSYWEVSPFNWGAGVCITHTEAIFSAKIKWHSVTIYPSVLFEAVTLKWEPLISLAVQKMSTVHHARFQI